MQLLTIEASSVRAGDYIYNSLATHPVFRWVRVTSVERTRVPITFNKSDGSYPATIINTSGWSTYKHDREAVTIRRPAASGA